MLTQGQQLVGSGLSYATNLDGVSVRNMPYLGIGTIDTGWELFFVFPRFNLHNPARRTASRSDSTRAGGGRMAISRGRMLSNDEMKEFYENIFFPAVVMSSRSNNNQSHQEDGSETSASIHLASKFFGVSSWNALRAVQATQSAVSLNSSIYRVTLSGPDLTQLGRAIKEISCSDEILDDPQLGRYSDVRLFVVRVGGKHDLRTFREKLDRTLDLGHIEDGTVDLAQNFSFQATRPPKRTGQIAHSEDNDDEKGIVVFFFIKIF